MKRGLQILLVLLCCAGLHGQTLHVPSQYSSIQSAITAADDNDTIIVSAGRYCENINFLGKAITVRCLDPNDPNIVGTTIIDGNQPADANKGSVVTFNSGEDNNSVLTGFTITGGSGTWLQIAWDLHAIYWNRCGGGAVCYNMSAPTISKNIFINNIAGEGGGIYVYGDPVNPTSPSNPPIHIKPVITDNTFTNNSAIVNHGFAPPDGNYPATEHGDGGAIVAFQGSDPIIRENLIQNNHALNYGGGIHTRQWSNALIEKNDIIDNNSLLGAGVHITYNSSPVLRGNLIKSNIATPLGGGGIYVYYLSKPLIEQNTITQNSSSNGAGIGVYWDSSPTIRNNFIYKNYVGAGFRIVSSSPKILNNTITGNNSGGINCESTSTPDINNNIITTNGNGRGIYIQSGSSPKIRYNDVWGNKAGDYSPAEANQTGINGNISIDPNFVNPDANNFHLDLNSPCKNAGDPNFVAGSLTDIDGEERIFNGTIDMGADEVVTNPFDLNNNGIVDYYELEVLSDEWLQINPGLQADFNSDGMVNFTDFAKLAQQWFWTAGWRQ